MQFFYFSFLSINMNIIFLGLRPCETEIISLLHWTCSVYDARGTLKSLCDAGIMTPLALQQHPTRTGEGFSIILGETGDPSGQNAALHLGQVVLGAWQDRVRDVSLHLLQLCGGLEVLGKRGETLGSAEESGNHMGFRGEELRTGEVCRWKTRRVGLW